MALEDYQVWKDFHHEKSSEKDCASFGWGDSSAVAGLGHEVDHGYDQGTNPLDGVSDDQVQG